MPIREPLDTGNTFDSAFCWSGGKQDKSNENARPDSSQDSLLSCPTETDDESMDDLVATLKHKLRLKSNSCVTLYKHSRLSPYSLDASQGRKRYRTSLSCANSVAGDFGSSHGQLASADDAPCQMMDLLKEGSLIKEAVRRLQREAKLRSTAVTDHSEGLDYCQDFCDTSKGEANPPSAQLDTIY